MLADDAWNLILDAYTLPCPAERRKNEECVGPVVYIELGCIASQYTAILAPLLGFSLFLLAVLV
jgi:hypothetical protein